MRVTAVDARSERCAQLRARVPEHLRRLALAPDALAAHQETSLRALLRAAIESSPFHAARLVDVDPERFELADLASLPVMTKAEMMASFDDVVTDRRVTRDVVEAHLAATGPDARELFGEHLVLASGGSSGERGVFVYSRAAACDYLLALLRPGLRRMIDLLGELPAEPPVVGLVAAGSGVHATRALASLFGGDLMDVRSVPATDPLPSIVDRLNDMQPLLLQGYPTVIRRLAAEQQAGRLRIAPLAVTTTSEPLSEDACVDIDDAFGVGVSDMFGSSEGVLGVSAPNDPDIVIASDLALVELVDAAGSPVAPGTPSARVLVTNLGNRVQPLIRYELGDSFTERPSAAPDGHLRVRVEGRCDGELHYGEVVVHPLAVRSVLVKVPAIVEYQVRQTARGIDVALVTGADLDVTEVAARLRAQLEAAGLHDPAVEVREVTAAEIARNPHTGKTARFLALSATSPRAGSAPAVAAGPRVPCAGRPAGW